MTFAFSDGAIVVQMNHVPKRATLVIPARAEMWAIVRTTARAIALQMDLPFEDLEDLRLGIAELCTLCSFGAEPDATCECAFTWNEELFEMTCVVSPITLGMSLQNASAEEKAKLELSQQILSAVVDHFDISRIHDGECRGSLRKDRASNQTQ
jgi:hypothetical protein